MCIALPNLARIMEIPWTALAPDTLRAVIEEFVLREGTEYGETDVTLEDKVAAVLRQLRRGEAFILYDPEQETTTIAVRQARSPQGITRSGA